MQFGLPDLLRADNSGVADTSRSPTAEHLLSWTRMVGWIIAANEVETGEPGVDIEARDAERVIVEPQGRGALRVGISKRRLPRRLTKPSTLAPEVVVPRPN